MDKPNTNTFAPQHRMSLSTGGVASLSRGSRIVVVGAGAFGGWSALFLLRKGFRVTLLDGWGPGNARSSSGDETRVIRSTYGNNELYFDLNVRALDLWKEHEKQFNKPLFYNTGVLWFCYGPQAELVDDSIPFAEKHAMNYEYLTSEDIRRRFPIVNATDLHHAYFDPFGGYLKARESCAAVVNQFMHEGGDFVQTFATPGSIESGRLANIRVSSGQTVQAETYLFACGPWLQKMFPEVLSRQISCTKQEVYYFGVPPSDALHYETFPAWIDLDGTNYYYGIAGNAFRGFKIGVDKRGKAFDPSADDHVVTEEVLSAARNFLAHRFPGLNQAPLLESRVCPYESSPTGNFIFDTHPQANNVIFLGGGSGHGFKHGPAVGELVADVFSGDRKIPDQFRIRPL